MGARNIEVLVPTGKPRVASIAVPRRVHDVNGKVLGFLWNRKPNGDILLHRIEEQLSSRYHFAGIDWQQKSGPTVSPDAAAAIIEELASNSDVVINAIAD